ncbi:MAG TPA: CDGSH iron-sulfur domain-containing protein [Gaiellaceae bacterium]|nr:CDGSH iron-sulfur domain-containing protein [Gaiellaceae bacterium]
MSEVTIRPMENGPYIVQGPVRVVDADGNEYDVSERKSIALCRCGGSSTKPFCDGTHKTNGFTATERAAPAGG